MNDLEFVLKNYKEYHYRSIGIYIQNKKMDSIIEIIKKTIPNCRVCKHICSCDIYIDDGLQIVIISADNEPEIAIGGFNLIIVDYEFNKESYDTYLTSCVEPAYIPPMIIENNKPKYIEDIMEKYWGKDRVVVWLDSENWSFVV